MLLPLKWEKFPNFLHKITKQKKTIYFLKLTERGLVEWDRSGIASRASLC